MTEPALKRELDTWPEQTTRGHRIPGNRYTSQEFFREEWEKMWTKVWLLLGRESEISAPGMGIASTLSSNATSSLFTSNFARMPGLLRYVSQGTSQASPHVAGVVALMLQNNPGAAFQEITQALILSARHDVFTGPGFTPTFG